MPTAEGPESGLGDFQLFGAYLAVQKPTFSFGIDPQLAAPTASEDVLGAGKWQGGLAVVAFGAPDPRFQVGGLLLWQASFAGDDDREDTSVMAIQPFAFWQLGGGTYLRTAPIWAFNLKAGEYHVPFGFGLYPPSPQITSEPTRFARGAIPVPQAQPVVLMHPDIHVTML